MVGALASTSSMVPWTFHIPIAKQCIANRVHMLTASYVSPAMAELHDEASRAGVCLMNEIGLDPGIDHMLAMQFIDNVHNKGGKVCAQSYYFATTASYSHLMSCSHRSLNLSLGVEVSLIGTS